jgi:tRNA A-37 threonylcarbamoyl transferase component Bud32
MNTLLSRDTSESGVYNNTMENYSTHQLRDKQLQPSTPFWLEFTLDGTAERWQCVNILRHFPGKRLVLQLRRDDSQMLCKLFFEGRDYQRELLGHSYLKSAGITTPEIQRCGALADGSNIIDYQFIEGQSLEQHNRQQALTPESAILQCAVAALADMHRHGLRQTDIHLGNFLYYQGIVYVVDTAAIRRSRAPLPEKQAIANFADLPGQFAPGQLDDLQPLIAIYQQHNPGTILQPDALAAAIAKKRDSRWRHYRGKLTRNCTEFNCRQDFSRFSVWRRDQESPALDQVLLDPDQSMDGGIYLKRGNTATVARADINGQAKVIKRYNIKDWRHQLSRCWRPSRGWRSWHNAHYLLFNGLQTPQPLALIEERFGPLRGRAFFICDYVAGTALKTVLQTADPEQRQQLTADFAGILRRYYQAGISHGDMKADNFIVTPSGITIIDLDPMQHHHHKPALEAALKKDIRRFLDNFGGGQGQAIADELHGQLPEALQS